MDDDVDNDDCDSSDDIHIDEDNDSNAEKMCSFNF